MYNRISIIGGSGTGKSTLCEILSNSLNLPAIHLDAINYNSNWEQVNKNKRDSIINSKSEQDKWIIDGNYMETLKNRLLKSDLIIWLDYSTFTQLKGIFKRFFKTYNKERPEIPGCKDHLTFKFIKYVATFNKKKRPLIINILKEIPENKLLVFKNQKDLNIWIKKFCKSN